MLAAAKTRDSLDTARVNHKDPDSDASILALDVVEYRVAATGAKATISHSKSLINQFCQKLPKDRYLSLLPLSGVAIGHQILEKGG